MSNEMYLGKVKFSMPPDQEEPARQALVEEAERILENKDMRASDIQTMIEGTACELVELTLDQLVECWGWFLIRELEHETDEIIDIYLIDDFSSDEENFFETIALFVTAGSYIDLNGHRGGDGEWNTRYGFTGKRVVELEAVFPPVPIEQ